MNNSIIYVFILLLTFVSTVILCKPLIETLKSKKVGQKILDIGPNWHKKKEGTPTMGGLSFLIVLTLFSFGLMILYPDNFFGKEYKFVGIITYSLLNGCIGIIDDLMKMKNGKNKGLTAKVKFSLQGIITIAFIGYLQVFGEITTLIEFPLINLSVDFGYLYYILLFFILCGFVNAVNLTDGLDGLASSIASTVGLFLIISAIILDKFDVGLLGACLLGVTLGFLVFNRHPAKVFMGDTGSLFLGGIVASTTVMFDNPFLVLFYGFIFLFEAFSVIIQVVYFKLSKGKRFFKMAPFHHHLEKSGWGENRVVVTLTIINMIFCLLALFLIKYEAII